MNHSLLTLNQNNFKTPVNAAAQSTLDADLCVLSLENSNQTLHPKKIKKNNNNPLSLMSVTTQSNEEVCLD